MLAQGGDIVHLPFHFRGQAPDFTSGCANQRDLGTALCIQRKRAPRAKALIIRMCKCDE
jgi:hypothetical protein